MATFRVGQRVKKVQMYGAYSPRETVPLGTQGIIVGAPGMAFWDYDVKYDGLPPERTYGSYGADEHMLAPLVDPAADAFMERIKRLEREPVNVTTKERA